MSSLRIARWSFLFFILTLFMRIAIATTEAAPPSPLLNFANTLFFWGIFAPLLYDWSRSRNGNEDRALFLLELADLLRLGVPVNEAVAKLAQLRGKIYGHRFAPFSLSVDELSRKLSAGSQLSVAFAEVAGIPKHWAAYTGYSHDPAEMARLLEELAESERSNLRLPFLSVLRIQFTVPLYLGIIVFVTTYILPTFVELFKGMEVSLPLITRLLIGVTRILSTLHAGAILSLLCMLLLLAIPFESLRRRLLRALFYVPGARLMVKLDCQHKIYRLIGAGLGHGVPQVEAVRAAALACDIPAYRQALLEAERAPLLSDGLAASPGLFDETFRWLVAQGERLESLPEALLTAAEVASIDLERRSRRLATALDTFVLAGIGVFVGFAVLAIFLPLYQLIGAMA